jgi:acetyltransferase-like isoleucine patch superfamily enzyme/acyl carrier protein
MTQAVANEERISTQHLLTEVQQTYPELDARDAFLLPTWFYGQKLWIEDSSHSDNALYNLPILLRIAGPLDEEILKRSLNEVCMRHHSLRSVFRIMNGRVVQIIVPRATVNLTVADLSSLNGPDSAARLYHSLLKETHTPFDLKHGTAPKAALFRVGADEHVLLLKTHHLACDDWSTGILVKELFALYDSFATGTIAGLPELRFQYGDFIRWYQRLPRNGALYSSHKEKLSGKKFYHLQTDFPRSAQRHRGATDKLVVSEKLRNDLGLLSRENNLTLFIALLAGFQCLLHLYSGDRDIGVATCAANRAPLEVEGLVGRFGNDLIVHTSCSGDPTLRELLLRTRDSALEGYSYRGLPFGALLEELIPVIDDGRMPLFQTMFILQNAPKEKPSCSDLTVERIEFDAQMAKYDLAAWITTDRHLEIAFEYDRDLFAEETIKHLVEDYQTVLGTMAAESDKRISDMKAALGPAHKTTSGHIPVIAAPARDEASDETNHPAGDLEAEVMSIWREVLGIKEIGIENDFLDLGGNSLSATQLLTRIEHRFAIQLPLNLLLLSRTVHRQALAIKEVLGNAVKPELAEVAAEAMMGKQLPANDTLRSRFSCDSKPTKSLFRRSLNRFLHMLCRFLPGATTVRPFLHRLRGVRVGRNVWIGDDVYIENEYPECVEIQDGAMIGLRTVIVAHTRGAGKIIVGRNAFIGAGSIVVTSAKRTLSIGEGSVLMASSVITSDVLPFMLYGAEQAKPLARVTEPFTPDRAYEEFIGSLRPLTQRDSQGSL